MRIGLGTLLLASAVFLMASGQALAVDQWPDTGQTDCYDNTGNIIPGCGSAQYPGQDGDHVGPTRSYTDNGQTVTDNVTGLLWQKDGSDSGALSLADSQTYVADLQFSGCSGNWVLPTAQELSSLVDASLKFSDDPINSYGDFILSGEWNPTYWTQTDEPGGSGKMLVRFRNGAVLGSSEITAGQHYVLAVCRN